MVHLKGIALAEHITACFLAVNNEANHQLTLKLTEAALTIMPVYDTVFGAGVVSNHLKKDIQNSSSKVRQAYLQNPTKCDTVEGLIKYEVQSRGVQFLRKDSENGVKNLLWMNRALSFILLFLEKCLITDKNQTSKKCATDAYNEVLKPYHGFFVSNIVTMAFNVCPTREQLIRKFEFPDEHVATEKVKLLLAAAKPVIQAVKEHLEKENCNFPDKV